MYFQVIFKFPLQKYNSNYSFKYLPSNTSHLKEIQDIIDLLESSIKHDGWDNITEWNIIKSGYDTEIDTYQKTITESHSWLSQYQAALIAQTGITTLKIKYTNVSGYFLEIPKSQIPKIPDNFIQRQTLVNAARFTTLELQEFESKLVEAQTHMAEKEYRVFQDIRERVLWKYKSLKNTSTKIGYTDFIASLSEVAYNRNYVCPKISDSHVLEISGWRHPVIESLEKDFVSNDLHLSHKDFIHVITGPNMGGKSTFLKQNALLVVMAHIWSFIPAREANISLTDKVFSRVWAHDNLFLGKSTFMVEMQEIAYILSNATKKSFIIIDEIGRGTSTYDGMSLAWAILRHIHDNLATKTLFATHYHEIIDESVSLKWVSNYSVAVWENEENLVFLRKIIPWGIKKSYWLEVASIAGIEKSIIKEAKNIAQKHQNNSTPKVIQQLSFSQTELDYLADPVYKILKDTDINGLTPIQSLNILANLKNLSEK